MMFANAQLEKLLDYLAETLDPGRQAQVEELHRRVLEWEPVERLPVVMQYPLPEEVSDNMPFRPYPHSEIFADPAKMLFNELLHAFDTSIACRGMIDDDLPCTVRANFGTVIIASLFGGRVEQVEENPPWVRHFDSLDEFRRAMDTDPTDLSRGWCPRVVETYQFYAEALTEHPELREMISVVLPDLQGPIDNVDMLRGTEFFTDFYNDPEMVAHALEQAATAQIAFARHLAPYLSDGPEGYCHQHTVLMPGNVLIRNDSSIMLSPEMYRERVAPHDERVLCELGGGGIHCCGKIEHNLGEFLAVPGCGCLDLGQPEMNDIDKLYAQAAGHGPNGSRKTPIIRLRVDRQELTSGSVMQRFPTGVSLMHQAQSLADAQETMAAYRRACE
ncbi:MAG: hypothetical protein JXM70_03245 [Pirellulales bacterium]|nr:hypothetical protein [Pirellulales bacterium]